METYREKKEWELGRAYDTVIYIGDGGADYCAALTLTENDFVLARKDYSMYRRIQRAEGQPLKAKPIFWENGTEVAEFIKNTLKS